jgi:hypothetical protein
MALWELDTACTCEEGRMKIKLAVGILFFVVVAALDAVAAGLPFIRDNYAKVLAESRQRKLPIFVECWAPW